MDFFCKIFCCCFYSKTNKDKKEKLLEGEELEELEENEVFTHQYYREDEKKVKLNLTKDKILKIIELEFDSNSEKDYKKIYEKEGLTLFLKEKSYLTDQFPLVKMKYIIPKKDFKEGTTIKDIISCIRTPEKRIIWDKAVKKYEILKKCDGFNIVHTWMNKPIIIISERDYIEKKFEFYNNGFYYSYSSSIDDNIDDNYKEIDNVVRIINYLSIYNLMEDDNNFIFRSLNQVDYKMPTPASLMSITLSSNLIKWYKNLRWMIRTNGEEEKENLD